MIAACPKHLFGSVIECVVREIMLLRNPSTLRNGRVFQVLRWCASVGRGGDARLNIHPRNFARRKTVRNDQVGIMWPVSKEAIGIILAAGRRYGEQGIGINAIHLASLDELVEL